jgi:hypothetical protein
MSARQSYCVVSWKPPGELQHETGRKVEIVTGATGIKLTLEKSTGLRGSQSQQLEMFDLYIGLRRSDYA